MDTALSRIKALDHYVATVAPPDHNPVSIIIPYDFNKVNCNTDLVAVMIDSFYGEDYGCPSIDESSNVAKGDALYDTICNIIDAEYGKEFDAYRRELEYDSLLDVIKTEYRHLRLVAHEYTLPYVQEGYYVIDVVPMGKDMILVLDSNI